MLNNKSIFIDAKKKLRYGFASDVSETRGKMLKTTMDIKDQGADTKTKFPKINMPFIEEDLSP